MICPEAVPLAEMPLAHVAENVPAIEFEVWLVTCHENPVQELADRFASGLEDQVPSIDGDDDGDAGVGVWAGVVPPPLDADDDVELGANTFDEVRS